MLVLAVVWLALGATVVVAAVRAGRDPRALRLGRWALAVLFVAAGAAVNAAFLLTGADYTAFADTAQLAVVRDTWRSLVAPNQTGFIGALIVFEAAAGLLVLRGGRATQVALVAMIGFHLALLSFGWGFALWSVPMVAALVRLLRAEREAAEPTVDLAQRLRGTVHPV
jgi:hypothetical protein